VGEGYSTLDWEPCGDGDLTRFVGLVQAGEGLPLASSDGLARPQSPGPGQARPNGFLGRGLWPGLSPSWAKAKPPGRGFECLKFPYKLITICCDSRTLTTRRWGMAVMTQLMRQKRMAGMPSLLTVTKMRRTNLSMSDVD
jgi:hypothetical protein